jgi:hypothetical protein
METIPATIITGIAATAVIDLWALVRRKLFGPPLPNYAFVGRWIAQIPHGRFRHASIATATPARSEALIGWTLHYVIGIVFAFLLLAVTGSRWFAHPTLAPALFVGVATVAAPFLVMQPAMGAGIAASRMPRPNIARLQSLITHAIFGLGLYAGALVTAA